MPLPRARLAPVALAALWAATGRVEAQGPGHAGRPPGAVWEGKAYTFTRIAEGVYHAVGTGALAVGANATVIVNPRDVVLVDSHVSPAAAWTLLQELRSITPLPVRTVINTHFHYDHAHGNQVYGPGVEVIGHEFTRAQLLAGRSKQGDAYEGLVRVLAQRPDSLRRVIAATTDPAVRREARQRLAITQRYSAAIAAVTPTPPGVTLNRSLVLHRGEREIRILFLGRAHTGGDVVVHLPRERVVITGDLVGSGLPFLGDGYIDEWATTLEALKTLDFDVILPGHGAPVRDRSRIDDLQGFLRDFHAQATTWLDNGTSPEDAEPRIDLSRHVRAWPNLATRSDDLKERLLIGLRRVRALRDGSAR